MLSVLHIGENFIFLVLYCVLSQKKSSGLWSAYTTKITNCFNTHSISIRAVRRSIMGGGGNYNLVPRLFTYARRFGKDPGWSWSRDSLKNPLLYRVGKVSNYMLPHTSDTFQMQGVKFNCYERQYKLFDLKLSIFVYFVCFISFIIVSV